MEMIAPLGLTAEVIHSSSCFLEVPIIGGKVSTQPAQQVFQGLPFALKVKSSFTS
jgi:hypothetical protein